MTIQWYPGHMAKAMKKVKNRLDLIDVVIELLDARIPISSRNPDLDQLLEDKRRIIALNKKDLANQGLTNQWQEYFSNQGISVAAMNSLNGKGVKKLFALANQLMVDKQKELAAQGRKRKDIRLMIVGIPNVGKSQLINQLSQKGATRTGNKPGVTKAQQWIKLKEGFELLDTPGVLWPKFEEQEVGVKLAICGAIKEGNFDSELLAYKLVEMLQDIAPDKLKERFKLDYLTSDTYQLVADIGRKRGCLQSGGRIDRDRVSNIILREFKEGKLGRLTLERPPKEANK
ncbi:ribosome biogenesis GTP-binding protein YlqF [Halobacteroides halobius DSM 5150]|uniref:Ribosome biogenesis GTPase A n=1 Tax=Halobacteroides halobius (strain ATCC 35273 / DSM 5150 / MD-1) TaxID=748449 RepID=L0K6E9_HALHC|nr:ribosome biogenesis GTPase YlqF [Halobacteroides halobius]AGB40606.1 ribosome biogenesis GTP-binding protein YlqF [Halobacteroides halobius DSM 5150]